MGRRERRQNDPQIRARAERFKGGAGGYGVNLPGAKPAQGQHPQVNPFMIPKAAGLNIFSQTLPNSYYVDWNLQTWREACDQAIRMGLPVSYAALTSWTYECSPFVQSLFRELEVAISKIPIAFFDDKGNINEQLTSDICEQKWFRDLVKETIYANFWGFSCINFDPVEKKIYKYPMQDVDPINRFLKQGTYNFDDGIRIEDQANLLFVQPSTSYESFLGWMQPITRVFIQMNLNSNNWVAAGRRLAFPMMTVGYPQADNLKDVDGNLYNPFKAQAEAVIANADPTNGMVYGYTIGPDGKIVKSLEINYEGTGANAQAYKLYSDFNKEQKDDIREMIMLSTLTSSGGKVGSQALGRVHQDKYEDVIRYTIDQACAELNENWLIKIKQFYNGFPDGIQLKANKAKEWEIDDVVKLVPVLKESGKKFSDQFFENMGLGSDYLEDAPVQPTGEPSFNEPEAEMATQEKRSFFGSIKKKSQLG